MAKIVYCVLCLDEHGGETVHIFSTQKKALAWSEGDERRHVHYDYVIDHPERMEEPMQ